MEGTMPIRCEIVTQDKLLFEGEVDMVVAPGTEGELGVLPHHAPLLTSLGYGILRVRRGGQEEAYVIAGGVMEVRPDMVTVLADVGENVAEIDLERAEQAKARAEELLKKGPPPDSDAYLAIEAALRRSNLRLEAARRYRRMPRRPHAGGSGEA
jgi:F-type H+-transporting ATPase subunit epsilon